MSQISLDFINLEDKFSAKEAQYTLDLYAEGVPTRPSFKGGRNIANWVEIILDTIEYTAIDGNNSVQILVPNHYSLAIMELLIKLDYTVFLNTNRKDSYLKTMNISW